MIDGEAHRAGDTINYNVIVLNKSANDAHNIVFEKILPDGLSFKSGSLIVYDTNTLNQTMQELEYDAQTRKITGKRDELKAYSSFSVQIAATVDKLQEGVSEKEIKSESTINIDGQKKIKSNETTLTVKKPNMNVLFTCSNQNEYIRGGEQVTFTTVVENNGSENAKGVSIEQTIPKGFKFIKGNYTYNGKTSSTYMSINRYVKVLGNVDAGKNFILTVTLEAEHLLEDTPTYSFSKIDGEQIDFTITDGIVQLIEKSEKASTQKNTGSSNSRNNSSSNITNNNNNQNLFPVKLSGTAWIDENENGVRDSNEKKLSNIKVIAFEAQTGNIATTISGNEASTTTNENGEYIFTDLKPGKYIVVFSYDSVEYTLTKYQDANNNLLITSDAIEKDINLNGKRLLAGVTDIIDLTKSTSNIDIGLVERSKFDLKLDKTVTKVTVQNGEGTKVHEYDNTSLALVPIKGKELNNTNIVVEYTINITNEGNVPGYAKNIIDYKPKEFTFNSNINPKWYAGSDGYLYSSALSDTIIQPGETKQLTLLLTKKLTENSTGIVNNNAEIKESYNQKGIKDRDSTEGNNIRLRR